VPAEVPHTYLVLEQTTTVLPAAYFDQLVASLDEPEDAPGLARAVRKASASLGVFAGLYEPGYLDQLRSEERS
jgi:hypothetical protein